MIRKIKTKLNNRAGESIAETLVALLISSLALVMLAGAISAASGVVVKSRSKLKEYYDSNENNSVIKMSSGGTSRGNITIKNSSGTTIQTKTITYYQNTEFGKNIVISYKSNE